MLLAVSVAVAFSIQQTPYEKCGLTTRYNRPRPGSLGGLLWAPFPDMPAVGRPVNCSSAVMHAAKTATGQGALAGVLSCLPPLSDYSEILKWPGAWHPNQGSCPTLFPRRANKRLVGKVNFPLHTLPDTLCLARYDAFGWSYRRQCRSAITGWNGAQRRTSDTTGDQVDSERPAGDKLEPPFTAHPSPTCRQWCRQQSPPLGNAPDHLALSSRECMTQLPHRRFPSVPTKQQTQTVDARVDESSGLARRIHRPA